MEMEIKKIGEPDICATALIWRVLPLIDTVLAGMGDTAPADLVDIQHAMIDCVRNEGAALKAVGGLLNAAANVSMVLQHGRPLDVRMLEAFNQSIKDVTDCLDVKPALNGGGSHG